MNTHFFNRLFQSFKKKALQFWIAYGKYLFALLALVMAVYVILIFEYSYVMWVAVIIGVITFISLLMSHQEINDFFVRLGWALIIFALFILISNVVVFDINGIRTNIFGLILAAFVCSALFSFCTYLSYLLKLKSNFHKNIGLNGVLGWLYFYLIFFSIYSIREYQKVDDFKFSKCQFVGIEKWDKEIYKGNTYYVIITTRGDMIGVPLDKYPEIRKITPNTKIKYLISDYEDVYHNVIRFEMKN